MKEIEQLLGANPNISQETVDAVQTLLLQLHQPEQQMMSPKPVPNCLRHVFIPVLIQKR